MKLAIQVEVHTYSMKDMILFKEYALEVKAFDSGASKRYLVSIPSWEQELVYMYISVFPITASDFDDKDLTVSSYQGNTWLLTFHCTLVIMRK